MFDGGALDSQVTETQYIDSLIAEQSRKSTMQNPANVWVETQLVEDEDDLPALVDVETQLADSEDEDDLPALVDVSDDGKLSIILSNFLVVLYDSLRRSAS